ncbi:hypothetical protein [Taklimakanibacter deserti]|uniref:hypothetical protein n=1 Tax=Taklimakanibacter deserti TaxID=2267839 RepID=UPI000E655A8E
MRSSAPHTVDHASDGMSEKTESKLSRKYHESGVRDRAPLSVALLSVAIQELPSPMGSGIKLAFQESLIFVLMVGGILLCALLAASARTSRLAVALFTAIAVIAIMPDWTSNANHTWLALWTIPVAVLFREWWNSDLYSFYLRATLGIVMIAAFSQKVMAGTYLDGFYIEFLNATGSTTERMFSILCSGDPTGPCVFNQMIGIFILAWQLIVGVLLLLGLNSLIFLAIEIAFLLGAGVFADEMNFQVLNIALLCIVFRFGMPLWLGALSIALLVIDLFTISTLVDLVVSHVG